MYMATTKLFGNRRKRGQRMSTGKGWRLVKGKRVFKASLISTGWVGDERVALFRVLLP